MYSLMMLESDSKKTTENRQFFFATLCSYFTYARDTYA